MQTVGMHSEDLGLGNVQSGVRLRACAVWAGAMCSQGWGWGHVQ